MSTGALLGHAWRVWVPAVVLNTALQALLVAPFVTPAASVVFVVLVLAAIAGVVVLIAALGGLRCRASRIVLHPGFTIPVFLLSYYGLYLSDLFDAAAASVAGHVALQVFFLVSGLLFILPILSTGPLPVRQSNLGRFFDIFVEGCLFKPMNTTIA